MRLATAAFVLRERFSRPKRLTDMNSLIRCAVTGALLCLVLPGPVSAQPSIPDALEPWRDWVLFGQEYRACPVLNGRPAAVRESHVCAWPGELAVDVAAGSADFSQSWQLYAEEWVPLAGDERYWPSGVTIDGEPRAAVLRSGRPTVRVPAGTHVIAGTLRWETRPASLPVPLETGIVALTLDGEAVAIPELDRGVLWLGLRPDLAVEEDRLNVQVYRRLTDSIPLRIDTQIELDVAGQSREVELEGAMLSGFVGESLSSGLPAELDADGTLRIQVRPGTWVVSLTAHHPAIVAEFTRSDVVAPWPTDEIWSFQSNPALRVAVLEGAPAIDSQRAGVPPAWMQLPSFAVGPGVTLDLVERSRNDALDENALNLTRFLWLDFDGNGFTAQDNVTGQLTSQWRLDTAEPAVMTSAEIDGEELLVTAGDTPGTQGVELRTTTLNLTTTARIPAQSSLPVTGYTQRFDGASTILFLPPAWRLVAAPGADTAIGAWLEQWRLLDIFLALIIAVASLRLFGTTGGIVALLTMVLVYHEPGAPRYTWLNLLLITALLRVLPEGRFRDWGRRYRYVSLAALALLLIPFVTLTLRVVIFPQLEQPSILRGIGNVSPSGAFTLGGSVNNLRGLNPLFGTRTLTQRDQRQLFMAGSPTPVEEVVVTGARLRRDDFTAPNAAAVASPDAARFAGDELVRSAEEAGQAQLRFATPLPGEVLAASLEPSIGGAPGRYQPGALVQTGPGLPDWAWSRYALSFSGPIEPGQTFGALIIGPWLVGLWRIAAVALSLAFAWLLVHGRLDLPRIPPKLARPRAGSAAGIAAAIALVVGGIAVPGVSDAQTADFPSPALLEELRNRLTEPAPCHPACAELTDARVSVGDTTLTMTLEIAVQDSVAVPIPGDASGWRPVRIDVDGANLGRLHRSNDGLAWIRLDAGVRRIELAGPIPPGDSFSLPFPQPPRRIEVAAPGYDVAGVADGRLPSGALELIRQAEPGDGTAIQTTAFPPYVHITRRVDFGLDWTVSTVVQRVSPRDGAFTIGVALLPEETVVTQDIDVENGVATIAFAAGQPFVQWQSRLPPGDALSLTAGDDVPWTETWDLAVGHEWHAEYAGVPMTRTMGSGRLSLINEFLPRPGETLELMLMRPEPVSGDTIAIDEVRYLRTIGERSSRSNITLAYRSTRAVEHPIVLPDGSELESVTIDGQVVPLRLDGNLLTLPVTPGEHQVRIEWRSLDGIGLNANVVPVDLGAGASNVTTTLQLPGNRWTLATYGPTVGPAVIYWAELAVFVLAAFILGRIALSPLRTHEWLLLGLGLSTFSWPVLLLFAAWAFVMSYRGRKVFAADRRVFNGVQVVLGLLTVVTVIALISSIANGLLGSPNMHIVSPAGGGAFGVVAGTSLSWFTDRIAGITPGAGVISVSLWFYKAAMLGWALWLSFALLRWLRWAWTAFSFDGTWRGTVKTESAP